MPVSISDTACHFSLTPYKKSVLLVLEINSSKPSLFVSINRYSAGLPDDFNAASLYIFFKSSSDIFVFIPCSFARIISAGSSSGMILFLSRSTIELRIFSSRFSVIFLICELLPSASSLARIWILARLNPSLKCKSASSNASDMSDPRSLAALSSEAHSIFWINASSPA